MFVLALSLYNTWNRGVFLLCKITNLLIYSQELIVVLLTFDTDEKGGDGGGNPNATYTNWQWHLVKTKDKKNWEIISWGY